MLKACLSCTKFKQRCLGAYTSLPEDLGIEAVTRFQQDQDISMNVSGIWFGMRVLFGFLIWEISEIRSLSVTQADFTLEPVWSQLSKCSHYRYPQHLDRDACLGMVYVKEPKGDFFF